MAIRGLLKNIAKFLVLSGRYGQKCEKLQSLGNDQYLFLLQSQIQTISDIIENAIAKRRKTIERLLSQ